MSKVSWLITDNNITVNYNNQTHIIPKNSSLANKLVEALKNKQYDEIPNMISVAKRIETLSKGNFLVKDGVIYVKGQPVSSHLGSKILKFSNEGLPFEPLVKFAENLQNNPSFRAVNELFLFLEKNDHPITDSGNFIAYKRVRGNFTDIHSGTFDNSVGNVVEMPRNQVDEDCEQTCSHGLHVANWDYAHTQFASSDSSTDIMLEVEVNPADVVAVPVDYNNSKMRVCKYVVLGVVDAENSSDVAIRYTAPTTVIVDDADDFEDEESSEEDDWDDESSEEDEYPFEDEVE